MTKMSSNLKLKATSKSILVHKMEKDMRTSCLDPEKTLIPAYYQEINSKLLTKISGRQKELL